jgi:hypothetical protein
MNASINCLNYGTANPRCDFRICETLGTVLIVPKVLAR